MKRVKKKNKSLRKSSVKEKNKNIVASKAVKKHREQMELLERDERKKMVDGRDDWMNTLFKKPGTYFVIAGVILALLVSKMLLSPPSQQKAMNSSYDFPKNSREIPKAITLRPANADSLSLYVTEGVTPLQMKDLVTYQRNGGLMVINSRELSESAIRNKGLDEVDALLEGKKNPDMNLISIAFFAKPAGSGAIGIMGELSDVKYPNTDASRAFITTFAQTLYPNVFVHVYAKKGNQYIELSKRISDPAKEEEYISFCNAASPQKDSKESLDCYWSMLSSDTEVVQKAKDTAKELVETFAISTS